MNAKNSWIDKQTVNLLFIVTVAHRYMQSLHLCEQKSLCIILCMSYSSLALPFSYSLWLSRTGSPLCMKRKKMKQNLITVTHGTCHWLDAPPHDFWTILSQYLTFVIAAFKDILLPVSLYANWRVPYHWHMSVCMRRPSCIPRRPVSRCRQCFCFFDKCYVLFEKLNDCRFRSQINDRKGYFFRF